MPRPSDWLSSRASVKLQIPMLSPAGPFLPLSGMLLGRRATFTKFAECCQRCANWSCSEFAQSVDVSEVAVFIGEPGWYRTNDLLIKSQLLYH